MIASPGDVLPERAIIRTIIHDWNYINALHSNIMLAPMGWDTHSSPELGMRAQDLINTRILKKCDLLIGVFWTRLGTPTGKALSGTVEEILEHVNAGKPAMIYFSSKPIEPQLVDSSKVREVIDFKKQCKEMGLVQEFENEHQFRALLSRHLPLALLHNPYIQQQIALNAGRGQAGSDFVQTANSIAISEDAKKLLREAAQSKNGVIIKISTLAGKKIQIGETAYGAESVREYSRWEQALHELQIEDLVVERGYNGDIYELTHQGWQFADDL